MCGTAHRVSRRRKNLDADHITTCHWLVATSVNAPTLQRLRAEPTIHACDASNIRMLEKHLLRQWQSGLSQTHTLNCEREGQERGLFQHRIH